jgi:hypothetical protein
LEARSKKTVPITTKLSIIISPNNMVSPPKKELKFFPDYYFNAVFRGNKWERKTNFWLKKVYFDR